MRNGERITIGILAHVDAGKTTLSEAVLHECGEIREPGRVDHGNAFMDTDVQEKERGITIFSGQADFEMPLEDGRAHVTLLDTPGHVDFSAEMERTLGVLDYAVLVISGKDGVQGHTVTLWNLLERYRVPVFFFVNKMDMEGADRQQLLKEIQASFGTECIDFAEETGGGDLWAEEAAMCDETLMEEYLSGGKLSRHALAKAIKARRIFPCFFGSALREEGVRELLKGLGTYGEGFPGNNLQTHEKEETLLRVFRITRDDRGERLTHVKVLRGLVRTRDTVNGEKINQIRICSGKKYRLEEQVGPGTVCCLTGLSETKIGQITGDTVLDIHQPKSEAVMSYGMILPDDVNVHDAYVKMKGLEEEDPQLRVTWNEEHQEIQVNLMGQVQLEVLQNMISDRFGIHARFGQGRIAYRETITEAVAGAGHYEPLRHFAEVHLLMEPLPAGSGLVFRSPVSSDELDTNWQRLIMTHLKEKDYPGTLTGSPVTDMKISIVAGKAHEKHTEGGDFRQATYRAVRQGLRKALQAKTVQLLEPWHDFRLEVPQELVGRAMADIQRMGGNFGTPENAVGQGKALLTGRAPASEIQDYIVEVASYTKGYGHLTCTFAGYEPCHNQQEVVDEIGYDPDSDADNPADSVFCEHGAGRIVSWNEADERMHVTGWKPESDQENENKAPVSPGGCGEISDKELNRIFERTFGKAGEKKKNIEAKIFDSELEKRKKEAERRRRAGEARKRSEAAALPEYLLVDGYNIIFAWDELKALAKVNIDSAREALIEILNNYQGYRKCEVIAVFDAYRVRGGRRHFEKNGEITVVYTQEAETADTYIERTTYELSGKNGSDRKYRVRVATSDRQEQMIIMGNNAARVSAADFRKEVEQVNEEIGRIIKNLERKNRIENPNRIKFT